MAESFDEIGTDINFSEIIETAEVSKACIVKIRVKRKHTVFLES
jgi:hypothetical protein